MVIIALLPFCRLVWPYTESPLLQRNRSVHRCTREKLHTHHPLLHRYFKIENWVDYYIELHVTTMWVWLIKCAIKNNKKGSS